MAGKIKILKEKLILAEGADALYFLIWALEAYNIDNIQVLDFGGIAQLSNYLASIRMLDGFDDVTTLVIARDAETNHQTAISSIQRSLTSNGFIAPEQPFVFTESAPKTAMMIFPGYDCDGHLQDGCLENLCLNTINDPVLEVAQNFISRINEEIEPLTHQHKSLVHSYLSVKNKFVGNKLGEAAKIGAWDWESEFMLPFKNILQEA